MRTSEDIDAYLMKTGLRYEEIKPAMWVVHDPATGENIVVSLVHDFLVFRVKVMELTGATKRDELYLLLLELNASEMVHGAYGIANDAVVLTCTLRVANLDYAELRGTIDDFSLAVTNHHPKLAPFRGAK